MGYRLILDQDKNKHSEPVKRIIRNQSAANTKICVNPPNLPAGRQVSVIRVPLFISIQIKSFFTPCPSCKFEDDPPVT